MLILNKEHLKSSIIVVLLVQCNNQNVCPSHHFLKPILTCLNHPCYLSFWEFSSKVFDANVEFFRQFILLLHQEHIVLVKVLKHIKNISLNAVRFVCQFLILSTEELNRILSVFLLTCIPQLIEISREAEQLLLSGVVVIVKNGPETTISPKSTFFAILIDASNTSTTHYYIYFDIRKSPNCNFTQNVGHKWMKCATLRLPFESVKSMNR